MHYGECMKRGRRTRPGRPPWTASVRSSADVARLWSIHDPVTHGEGRGLESRVHLELGQDVLYVRPNGVPADPELSGDRVAREPLGEESQNVERSPAARAARRCGTTACPPSVARTTSMNFAAGISFITYPWNPDRIASFT